MAFKNAQARISPRRPQPNRRLVELRINQGLTPNQLGHRAGISGNTVRAAEAGYYIEVPQQHAIATALGLPVLAIFPFERQRVAR